MTIKPKPAKKPRKKPGRSAVLWASRDCMNSDWVLLWERKPKRRKSFSNDWCGHSYQTIRLWVFERLFSIVLAPGECVGIPLGKPERLP